MKRRELTVNAVEASRVSTTSSEISCDHDSRLVGEGSRTRDDSSGSRGEDVSGHDADLASSTDSRGNDTWAVGSYETRLGLATKDLGDLGEKERFSLVRRALKFESTDVPGPHRLEEYPR